ncbi:MAG: amidohydrolase family protein [Bilophila wadsworthia]
MKPSCRCCPRRRGSSGSTTLPPPRGLCRAGHHHGGGRGLVLLRRRGAFAHRTGAGALAVRVHVNPFTSLDPDDPRLAFDGKDVTIGGVKLLADGSLQGYTGYLTKPYHTPYQGDPEWRGYPTHSRENLFALIEAAHGRGQFLIHTNGDAATDDALDALEAAQAKHPRKDCRHILIHAQTIREEQLDRLGAAGYTPSFFTAHVYYWGDRHRDLFLGPERARPDGPMRSALDRGLVITAHATSSSPPIRCCPFGSASTA